MIELLIAMAILMMVTVSLLKYQLLSLRRVKATYLQTIALNQMQNLLEQLRNAHGLSVRKYDLSNWNQQNQHLLPGGVGKLNCKAFTCRVTLQWYYKRDYSMSLSGVI